MPNLQQFLLLSTLEQASDIFGRYPQLFLDLGWLTTVLALMYLKLLDDKFETIWSFRTVIIKGETYVGGDTLFPC